MADIIPFISELDRKHPRELHKERVKAKDDPRRARKHTDSCERHGHMEVTAYAAAYGVPEPGKPRPCLFSMDPVTERVRFAYGCQGDFEPEC